MWSAEAYGSDCFTPLAWYGAATRVQLGTAVCQMAARTPVATAMTALTLDHLTDGRFILGLGASGPQVVEGWYGQPYPKPLARTREYIDIVRQVLAREEPVTFDGEHFQLPRTGDDTTGLGKPLKSITHPLRADLPIYLGAEGPKNVALAAEIADGWLPMFMSPGLDPPDYRECLEEGWARPGARRGPGTTSRSPTWCRSSSTTTWRRRPTSCACRSASTSAAWAPRRSTSTPTCSAAWATRTTCKRIQDLFLGGRKEEAIASVPLALVEDVALVGPDDKVREDLERWRETCITTLLVSGPPSVLENIANLVRA